MNNLQQWDPTFGWSRVSCFQVSFRLVSNKESVVNDCYEVKDGCIVCGCLSGEVFVHRKRVSMGNY